MAVLGFSVRKGSASKIIVVTYLKRRAKNHGWVLKPALDSITFHSLPFAAELNASSAQKDKTRKNGNNEIVHVICGRARTMFRF